jgi:hypothetical protein
LGFAVARELNRKVILQSFSANNVTFLHLLSLTSRGKHQFHPDFSQNWKVTFKVTHKAL